EGSVDLILMDHLMPVMTGQEALTILRETYSPFELPIIMVTALYDTKSIIDALNTGANDYINKPFDFDVLQARVNVVLERTKMGQQLHKAKEQADKENKAKSDFLSNMSHELRSPLNAVLGFCQLLQAEIEQKGSTKDIKSLEQIYIAGNHLLSLINDILDFSKIGAGKLEIYWNTLWLPHFIQSIVTATSPLIKNNNNKIEVHCDDDVGDILTDESRLRQVMFNLISNAAKFTEQGTITLLVEKSKQGDTDIVNICVKDTGIGIAEKELEFLFKSFSQVKTATTHQGTGLGLTISRELCQKMGGDIKVESIEGKGSIFTVSLPVTQDSKSIQL
ncbi:MAG: HAMP domain-containing histidine kinase, partial [Proteobacteria bacterium]|nr:HAMP domain-containing histidine kinase [Pseudomonadota bacterium]